MGLLGSLVRTAVNVATLPLAVTADVVTVATDVMSGETPLRGGSYTAKNLQQLKDEAD